MNEKPVRSRRKAHNSSVLSVAWSPLRDAVVATGSSDRTVKVWSTEDGSLEEWDASPSGVTVEPYTIFAGHEVWRLHWCCPDSYRTPPLLATVNNSPQLDNLGRVFVWDLVNPHLPVCTLDGHEHDLCVDFAWLSNSSSSSKRASTAPPGPPPDRVVRSSSNSSRTSAGGGKSTAAAPTGWWGSGASVRGVLSVGRDGRLLVQELSSGWRPSSHMSSSIMAVSSKGHVAYHRGAQDLQVRRLSLLLLFTAAVGQHRGG
jgi:WD40 repeat protein